MARKVALAEPHGFCSGVRHAISLAEEAVEGSNVPVYCLNELVHNRLVVDRLAAAGMVFVKDVDEVPEGGTLLFSAHGVSPGVRAKAAKRSLRVIDATCVFVKMVHEAVRRNAAEGRSVLLVGSARHDEVVGVAGEAPSSVIIVESEADAETVEVPDPSMVALLMQTTLAEHQVRPIVDILRRRFPEMRIPDKSGICAATTVRQRAVREIAASSDVVVILGSRNSANSNRLVEVARDGGAKAILVEDIDSLRALVAGGGIPPDASVGLSAGASTPEYVVDEALSILSETGR